MNVIGFTGSRAGMSVAQQEQLSSFLNTFDPTTYVHHGCCVGSDEQFNEICLTLGKFYITGHPGVDIDGRPKNRSTCPVHTIWPEKQYLDRNRDIVGVSNVLIATPNTMVEERRSGTWSTIRYATASSKNVVLIFPDGSVKYLFQ